MAKVGSPYSSSKDVVVNRQGTENGNEIYFRPRASKGVWPASTMIVQFEITALAQ